MAGSLNRVRSVFREATSELFSSKLSLFFMSFGLVVGICAITAIYSVGNGAKITVYRILENLNFGSNAFLILAGGGKFFGPSATRMDRFKMRDVRDIKKFDFVVDVSPVQLGMMEVSSAKEAGITRVLGVFPVYATVNNWTVAKGRFISDADIRLKRKVCVLGYETAERLFGKPVLGKKIRVNGVALEVVGILERKGVIGSYHLDERVLIPFTTAKDRIFNKDWIDAAKVLLKKNVDFVKAKRLIRELLRRNHKLLPNEVDDFRIITPDQIMRFLTKATTTLTALLVAISLITLVVAGVIIMNIMYAVVEEKKKIIALRKAYGATNGDIVMHYLFITGMVALVGFVAGYGLGNAVTFLVASLSPIDGYYSLSVGAVGLLLSFVTSVGFGIVPARSAAKLPPAEILK